jgi:hypothetical protein
MDTLTGYTRRKWTSQPQRRARNIILTDISTQWRIRCNVLQYSVKTGNTSRGDGFYRPAGNRIYSVPFRPKVAG